jgi:hypothetical protein
MVLLSLAGRREAGAIVVRQADGVVEGVLSAPPAGGAAGYADLGALPPGHALRCAPLRDVRAECRNRHGGTWREVSRWAIGVAAYEALGTSWIDNYEFRAPARATLIEAGQGT